VTALSIPQRGFVLGKFMPPHQGHIYLCEFARHYVRELTILVCSLPQDPVPGELRAAWMRELFPSCRVLWCEENLPQAPEDDAENFWPIWRDVVRRYHPEPVDVVFASEAYGQRLAAEVGAVFAPCDLARAAVPCSGTDVRRDPFGFWHCIPAPVRPYFAKRVCVFGPESSGKTTLAGDLAAHYETVVAPEYGRLYTDIFGTRVNMNDLQRIVAGHLAGARAAARQANRIVIEDTDPVLTGVWAQMLLGCRADWLDSFDDYADLYLLCDIDIAWADDGTRYFPKPEDRQRFFDLCKDELVHRGIAFEIISGSREARRTAAVAAIERNLPSVFAPSRFAR
jgi:HTH-type transcriptional regulator, transcriptional repressor of NAD biosynthesis genes